MITRPMLSATAKSTADLRFPCSATPKIDGIRALRVGDEFLTRSFKHVQNAHIRDLCLQLPSGVDGELWVEGGFQETTSAVMSRGGVPNFTYMAFDYVDESLDVPYTARVERLRSLELPSFVQVVLPTHLYDLDDFAAFEESCLAAGFEGVMMRSAVGPYKCGRSSLAEYYLVKCKRVQDSEAIVLNVVEGRTNLNPIVPNAFGYARRPGGRVHGLSALRGTMGHLECRDVHTGVLVSVGSGFKDTERDSIWRAPEQYIGRVLKYSYQQVGVKDKPRFPRFIGWRDSEDM